MTQTENSKTGTKWIVSLALAASLSGCGGGGGDDPDCGGDLAVAVTGGLSCLGTVTKNSPPPPPPAPPPPPPPATGEPPPEKSNRVHMEHFTEFEPNNVMDNANPVSFRSAPATDHIGISVKGTVTQDSDPSDFVIFTPTRTGPFLVYVRRNGETEIAETDSIYIAAYDQSQSTIDATPIGIPTEQILHVEFTAGLAYYVQVNGYNTGTIGFDYELVIID